MTRATNARLQLAGLAVFALTCGALAAQNGRPARPGPSAKKPKWEQSVLDLFFEDARRELGDPATRVVTASPGAANPAGGGNTPGNAAGPVAGIEWSKLISAATIEAEIKRHVPTLEDQIKTPSKFKSSGYGEVRKEYTYLSILFAIIAEYDGDIRWKAQAAGLKAALAKSAKNCKSGTDNGHKEAKELHLAMTDLIQGNPPSLDASDAEGSWGDLIDLAPLMARLDLAREERIGAWTSSKSEMTSHADELRQEAEVLAALGHILQDESFEKAKDETFRALAKIVEDKGLELIAAVDAGDADMAQNAVAAIRQSCDDCHTNFQ